MSPARFGYASLISLLWLLPACSEDSDPTLQDAGSGEQAHGHEEDEGESSDVPCPPETPIFEPGLSAPGRASVIEARLVSAAPETPHKYENSWVLEFVDAEGKPIEDIVVDSAKTYMPVHAHGGGTTPKPISLSEPGRVQIDKLNFTMAGPWQVTFQASSASVGKDTIVFDVCVGR